MRILATQSLGAVGHGTFLSSCVIEIPDDTPDYKIGQLVDSQLNAHRRAREEEAGGHAVGADYETRSVGYFRI